LLRLRGLNVNAKISDWLPAGWVKGPGFGNAATDISFKQLLDHTSGLRQANLEPTNWTGMQNLVANANLTPILSPNGYAYSNANYALLGVLIPNLRNGIPSHANVNFRFPVDSGTYTVVTSAQGNWSQYSSYMQYLVARAVDVPVTCQSSSLLTNEAFFYQLNTPGSGINFSSHIYGIDGCGSFSGLRMSAQDTVKYWDRIRYDDNILTEAERNRIRGGQGTMPGWSPYLTINGTNWYAVGHNGNWVWGDGNGNGVLNTCLVEFPGDITASLIFNSLDTSGASVCQNLRDAYQLATSGLNSFAARTYQAESATLSGASVLNSLSGFTGTGYVDTSDSAGHWIEFNVDNIPYSGIYSINIKYSNGSSVNRPINIAVNGTVESTAKNASLAGWNTWSNESVNIPLVAGNNKVRFIFTSTSGSAFIDSIILQKAVINGPL
jgi:CubicO group peptidase (beta-lactamase class C family)